MLDGTFRGMEAQQQQQPCATAGASLSLHVSPSCNQLIQASAATAVSTAAANAAALFSANNGSGRQGITPVAPAAAATSTVPGGTAAPVTSGEVDDGQAAAAEFFSQMFEDDDGVGGSGELGSMLGTPRAVDTKVCMQHVDTFLQAPHYYLLLSD